MKWTASTLYQFLLNNNYKYIIDKVRLSYGNGKDKLQPQFQPHVIRTIIFDYIIPYRVNVFNFFDVNIYDNDRWPLVYYKVHKWIIENEELIQMKML